MTILLFIVLVLICVGIVALLFGILEWLGAPATESADELKPSLSAAQLIPPPIPLQRPSAAIFAPPSESKPPPLPPVEPEPSVTAAEFLAQIKVKRAEQEQAPKPIPAEPEIPEAPKKRSKLLVSLMLCVVFGLGTIAGSIGGCAAASRYQLVALGDRAAFRVDKLTGKTWLVLPNKVRPLEEQ
jgi:hypothetical protein